MEIGLTIAKPSPYMILVNENMINEYMGKGWWGTDIVYVQFILHVETRPNTEAIIDPLNRAEIYVNKRDTVCDSNDKL